MELTNEFDVPVPVDQAWAVLTDPARVATCLPGTELDQVTNGDGYGGSMTIKLGPITANYRGNAHVVSLDHGRRRAVVTVRGHDVAGQGEASATMTAELADRDGATHVSLLTDLAFTGKVAQFGGDALADATSGLVEGFVANLEEAVLTAPADASPVTPGVDAPAADVPAADSPAADSPAAAAPAGTPAVAVSPSGKGKRALVLAVVGVVAVLVIRRARRRLR